MLDAPLDRRRTGRMTPFVAASLKSAGCFAAVFASTKLCSAPVPASQRHNLHGRRLLSAPRSSSTPVVVDFHFLFLAQYWRGGKAGWTRAMGKGGRVQEGAEVEKEIIQTSIAVVPAHPPTRTNTHKQNGNQPQGQRRAPRRLSGTDKQLGWPSPVLSCPKTTPLCRHALARKCQRTACQKDGVLLSSDLFASSSSSSSSLDLQLLYLVSPSPGPPSRISQTRSSPTGRLPVPQMCRKKRKGARRRQRVEECQTATMAR